MGWTGTLLLSGAATLALTLITAIIERSNSGDVIVTTLSDLISRLNTSSRVLISSDSIQFLGENNKIYFANCPSHVQPVILPKVMDRSPNIFFEESEENASLLKLALVPALAFGAWKIYESYSNKSKRLMDDNSCKFSDVVGYEGLKAELSQIVEVIHNPKRFEQNFGVRPPRGVLLDGPSGTGKTMMARATAGEAGVPFFYASAASFMEVYVGKGARRVRDLFEEARKNAPCIVFIDEIDTIGGARSKSDGSENIQTINQLLTEMDGIDSLSNNTKPVVVMAATNRYKSLDPALLRPGRFDKIFRVSLPDEATRLQLFLKYAEKKRCDGTINFADAAERSDGLCGADIENIMNEAALVASRLNSHVITITMFESCLINAIELADSRNQNHCNQEFETNFENLLKLKLLTKTG